MISLNKLAFIAVSFGAVSISSASIINFEGHGDDFNNPADAQGFRFSYAAGGWAIIQDGTDLGFSVVHNGTTRLIMSGGQDGANAQVSFKPIDDSAFSLQKLDGATLFPGAQGGFDVIGTFEGGGTVTASFSSTDSFATYLLPGTFVNLDKVVVRNQVSGATFADAGVSIDNIVVNQPVPEPTTLATFGLALAAFAKRRRKN